MHTLAKAYHNNSRQFSAVALLLTSFLWTGCLFDQQLFMKAFRFPAKPCFFCSSHSIGCLASTRSFVAHSNSGSRRIHGSASLLRSASLPHLLPTYFVDHDGSSLHLYGSGALEVLDTPIQHTGKQKPVEEVHFHFIEFEEIAYWLTKLAQAYPHTTVSYKVC